MPTGRQIHVDTPLSNLLVAAFEAQGDFVGMQLFPVVPVGKQSDKYYTLKKESWLTIQNTRRSPKTRANRIEFDVSSDSYFADNYAIGADIALEDLANADTGINLRSSNTSLIARMLMADAEVRIAATATLSGNHAGQLLCASGPTAWDSVNSADIVGQFTDAHLSIFRATGLRANVAMMDYQSYVYAKNNSRLFSRFQYRATGPALVSDAQLMEALSVDRLLVARSQKNVANANQTGSITSIWGPTAILARVEGGASMQAATWGLSFRWTDPQLGAPMAITTAVEDGAGSRKIEVLEGGYFQDEKIVAKELSYYIKTNSSATW
jgi:hypothetical protein